MGIRLFERLLKLLSGVTISPKAYSTGVPSGGMGYRGWIKLNGILVPIKSCTLDETPNPYVSEDLIHGSADEPNAASAMNWSEGHFTYEGSIGMDLFQNFWSTLKDWVSEDRHTGKTVIASPNNQDTYQYNEVMIDTCTITGTLQGKVDVQLGVKAKSMTSLTPSSSTPQTPVAATTGATLNQTPVPYWKTFFEGSGWGDGVWGTFGLLGSELQVLSWSLQVANNTLAQYTFDGTQYAHYIQQGMKKVTGSFTVYCPTGTPIPNQTLVSGFSSAIIRIKGAGTSQVGTITIPNALVLKRPMPFVSPTAQQKVIRNIDFQALGTETIACAVFA